MSQQRFFLQILKLAFSVLKEDGFVISRESPHCKVNSDLYPNTTIITIHRTPSETIVLLRQRSQRRETRYIEINSSEACSWLPEVQDALNRNPQDDLVLYSQDPMSGILGMMTSLRKEYISGNIRCVFFVNEGEEFDLDSRICNDQLKKNLTFNVYKNGEWGTFRHLPLGESNIVEVEHCFVDITSRGDLSNLAWTEGTLTHRTTLEPEKKLVYVSISDNKVSDANFSIDANRHYWYNKVLFFSNATLKWTRLFPGVLLHHKFQRRYDCRGENQCRR